MATRGPQNTVGTLSRRQLPHPFTPITNLRERQALQHSRDAANTRTNKKEQPHSYNSSRMTARLCTNQAQRKPINPPRGFKARCQTPHPFHAATSKGVNCRPLRPRCHVERRTETQQFLRSGGGGGPQSTNPGNASRGAVVDAHTPSSCDNNRNQCIFLKALNFSASSSHGGRRVFSISRMSWSNASPSIFDLRRFAWSQSPKSQRRKTVGRKGGRSSYADG